MSPVRRNRHVAVAATVATAAASWAVATEVAGVTLGVKFAHAAASTVALGPTVGVAASATVAGWVVMSVLETRVSNPLRTWVTIATAVLVASLALPIAFATSVSAVISLIAIHLAVGAVAIAGLARTTTSHRIHDDASYTSPASLGARTAA